MKNKKGFLFAPPLLIAGAILVLVILILGVIFALRIKDGLLAIVDFMQDWAIWIIIVVLVLAFLPQSRAIVNYILKWFGVKV